jgi:hypothetical protein
MKIDTAGLTQFQIPFFALLQSFDHLSLVFFKINNTHKTTESARSSEAHLQGKIKFVLTPILMALFIQMLPGPLSSSPNFTFA